MIQNQLNRSNQETDSQAIDPSQVFWNPACSQQFSHLYTYIIWVKLPALGPLKTKRMFPLMQHSFTTLIFSTKPSAPWALSIVCFRFFQIICQSFSYLYLKLCLWTDTHAFLLSSPPLWFSLSFQPPPFLNVFFPFFSLVPSQEQVRKCFHSYFPSCLHFSGLYKEPNEQNEVNRFCACISILRSESSPPQTSIFK